MFDPGISFYTCVLLILISAKMCSLIGFAEAIIPMVYGPMYLQIYANTLKSSVPGVVYIVGSVMTVPAILIFT